MMNSSLDINDEPGDSGRPHSSGKANPGHSDHHDHRTQLNQDSDGCVDGDGSMASRDGHTKTIADALQSWNSIGKLASGIGAFALRHKVQSIRQGANTTEEQMSMQNNTLQFRQQWMTANQQPNIWPAHSATSARCPRHDEIVGLGLGNDSCVPNENHEKNNLIINAESDKKTERCTGGDQLHIGTASPPKADETKCHHMARRSLGREEEISRNEENSGKKRPLGTLSFSQAGDADRSDPNTTLLLGDIPSPPNTRNRTSVAILTGSTCKGRPESADSSATGCLHQMGKRDSSDSEISNHNGSEHSEESTRKKRRVLPPREEAAAVPQLPARTTQREDFRMGYASRPSLSEIADGNSGLADTTALSQLARLNLLWRQYQFTHAQLACMFQDLAAVESSSGKSQEKQGEGAKSLD